jgi:hypothetical protein
MRVRAADKSSIVLTVRCALRGAKRLQCHRNVVQA